MDQTPSFPGQFDLEFFQSLQFPQAMGMPDNHDVAKRKASYAFLESPSLSFRPPPNPGHNDGSFFDNMQFFFQQRDDDGHHGQFGRPRADSLVRGWQPPHVQNLLDLPFEPEMNIDNYQIARSRGGSFNFGRIRRESEDFFNMSTDFFKHIRNMSDIKPNQSNNLLGKSQNHLLQDSHSPKPQLDMHNAPLGDNFMLPPSHYPNPMMHFPHNPMHAFAQNHQDMSNLGIMASARNTDSTIATTADDESHLGQNDRKKRMLNDRSEAEDGKDSAKGGKNKKTIKEKIEDDDSSKPKSKSKPKAGKNAANKNDYQVKAEANEDRTTERFERSTNENSSRASKIEDSPASMKPKTPFVPDFMKMKNSGNVEELLKGLNVPEDVQDYLKNSNVMGQMGHMGPMAQMGQMGQMGQMSWMETKKIGTLTLSERRAKIEKYLEKRKKRTWSRRINYDCRKRVADSRLRIKGRFVTRDQAFVLMTDANIPFDPETISNEDIKTLLTEKFGAALPKKKPTDQKDTIVHLKRPAEHDLNDGDMDEDERSDLYD